MSGSAPTMPSMRSAPSSACADSAKSAKSSCRDRHGPVLWHEWPFWHAGSMSPPGRAGPVGGRSIEGRPIGHCGLNRLWRAPGTRGRFRIRRDLEVQPTLRHKGAVDRHPGADSKTPPAERSSRAAGVIQKNLIRSSPRRPPCRCSRQAATSNAPRMPRTALPTRSSDDKLPARRRGDEVRWPK